MTARSSPSSAAPAEAPPAEAAEPELVEPTPIDPIAVEWADQYDEGDELFCGSFDADDFDLEYGTEYPDGTTVAVRRCANKPSPGWIRQHAGMSDLQRTFALLERHCSEKALEILDSLTEDAWDEFVLTWGKDGGLIPGKLNRSARRGANTRTR